MRHVSFDPRCARCFMKPALCLCGALTTKKTTHHLRVLVHDLELLKSTNTGRFLPLLLENAALVPYGGRRPDPPDSALWPAGTRPLVLFPLNGAPSVEELVDDDPTPRTLIALDGTWHQANRLRKRFHALGVPFARLAKDTPSSAYQLRRGHFAGSLSTLEAAARALSILEGDADVEAHCQDGFRRFVDRTLWLRGEVEAEAVYGGIPAGLKRHEINKPRDEGA